MPTNNELLDAALEYAALGYKVFPLWWPADGKCMCKAGSKCGHPCKHPICDWQREATTDETIIRAWWARNPRAGIGIKCGAESNLVVVDVDGDEGLQSLMSLEAEHGGVGHTRKCRTGKGWHLYFKHPQRYPVPGRIGFAPGLDVRADGNYVVAPPSQHINGHRYAWLNDDKPLPMPAWVQATTTKTRPAPVVIDMRGRNYLRSAVDREVKRVTTASEGSRNKSLYRAAFSLGQLVAGNLKLDPNTARRELHAAALEVGLGEVETIKTIESGLADGLEKPRDLPEAQPEVVPAPEPVPRPAPEPPPRTITLPIVSVEFIESAEIFTKQPEPRWTVESLHIGPGRPTLIVGYGASAKTLAAQQLALAKASGRDIWNRFECSPGRVLHLDYEQGRYATIVRYQRLALGHGITHADVEGRLTLAALPRVFLDDRDALEKFMRMCERFDLCIIDAFRGAAPQVNENDSQVRNAIDLLTYVSEQTGCAHVLLHHAGKPKEQHESDDRTLARGNSAIFDAAGCVLNFTAKSGEQRKVKQVKQPSGAVGAELAPFGLVVSDVPGSEHGVRVSHAELTKADPGSKAKEAYERDLQRIMEVVKMNPGISSNAIVLQSGMRRGRVLDLLAVLVSDNKLAVTQGKNRANEYRPV
jgi:hypothetical protein